MDEPTKFDGGINGIPQFADRKQMWEELVLTPIHPEMPALVDYLTTLRELYCNGSVILMTLRAEAHPVFDCYLSRNQPCRAGYLLPANLDYEEM